MKNAFIKRMLSFLLALVMVLGMIPVNTVHVHATETSSRSGNNEDTYLELDYDKPPYKVDSNGNPVLDEDGNLIYLTPEQALSEEAESNRTVETTYSNGKAMDYDYYWSDDNTDQWRQVFKGDAKASGGNFRKWMESTDPDDQYIVLMEDMKINVGSGSDWETIVITSNKVLDLNGHTLEFYDQRNGTGDQNTGYYKHASHLFEINNNARLTVIDSGGNSITKTTSDGEIILGDEPDTGRIYANAYMINHQKWDFWYYTHRDIFHVVSGDLVIYGGEYQAGRQKDQLKSNFSWKNLKEVIGDAVALGTAVYEYATGIEGEFAKRADILDIDMYEDLREDDNEENKDDTTKGSEGTSKKKDGKKGATQEKTTDTPASKGNADGKDKKKDQTIAQKKTEDNKKKEEDKKGDKSTDNKAEEGKDAKPAKKDPENSKIAEANKAIGGAILDSDKITAMYDTAVKFGEGLYNLFGSDEATRATACIHGTVARVADNCTLVIYGGKFTGYGSTPNVRNAVIEVSYNRASNGIQTSSDPRYGRTQGGAVYVFDGTFTAMAGANVFNMYIVNRSENLTTTVWTVREDENGNRVVEQEKVPLYPSETFGLETVTYEKVTYNGVTQDMPVDTGNIMVRGGTFRCYFEPTMMATLNPDTKGTDKNDGQYCPTCDKYDDCDCDDVDHNKFSGTVGSVNLGVQSFDEDMIRDGRIQLVDVYGSGNLVLLDGGDPIDPNPEADSGKTEEEILADEQKAWDEFIANGGEPSSEAPDNTYTTNITKEGGIRKYRLFISDVELRALEYLTVHPNTATTNSTESFALQTYYGTPTDRNPKVTQPWVTDDENIRAPYSSNEGYFEFEFDDPGYSEGIFISPDLKLNGALLAGEDLAKSPVWYYTIPVNAAGESLGDFSYTDTFLRTEYEDSVVEASFNRTREENSGAYSEEFWWGLEDFKESNTEYFKRTDEKYSTNIKFFVYKIYRVDPLSRESINESDEWSANEPLLELRYGANNDSVKCIVTLKELEKAIEKRLREKGEIGANESWSYRSGDLFRIVFSVEERMGYGYTGSQTDGEVKFLNELAPANAEASILIRCVSKDEDKDSYHYNPTTGNITYGQVADWTPLQFVRKNEFGKYVKNEEVTAGSYATVELVNGQTAMVDWQGARIFDIYYQWYLMDDPTDTTPTLIAGTDNVWIAQNPYGSKQFHKPDNFLLKDDGSYEGINGEHYANTVDPDSSDALAYTFGPNGLPVNTEDVKHSPDLWTNEMLHMYTYETANSEPGMKKFTAADIAAGRAPAGTKDKIYLANNNTFWGNTDSLYIPAEYEGKFLMCKMVAVNVRYPYLYDNLQTIYSHVVKIGAPEAVPELNFAGSVVPNGTRVDVTNTIAEADVKIESIQTDWFKYEGEGMTVMQEGDTYEPGATYQLMVSVTPAPGYSFNGETAATYNTDLPMTNVGSYSERTWTWACDVTIPTLEYNVTVPMEWGSYVYVSENEAELVDCTAPFSITDANWVIYKDGKEQNLVSGDTFQAGYNYFFRFRLESSAPNAIPVPNYKDLTVYVDGSKAIVRFINGKQYFSVTKNVGGTIDSVGVSVGGVEDGQVPGSVRCVDERMTMSYRWLRYSEEDGSYWVMQEGETFEAGTKYRAEITLEPVLGFDFDIATENLDIDPWFTVASHSMWELVLHYDKVCREPGETFISASVPLPGMTYGDFKASRKASYYSPGGLALTFAGGWKIYDENMKELADTHVFSAGETYDAEFRIRIDDYGDGADYFFVNDVEAIAALLNSSQQEYRRISYDFTVPSQYINFTEIQGLPVVGEPIAFQSWATTSESHAKEMSFELKWEDEFGNSVAGEIAEAGETYYLSMTLKTYPELDGGKPNPVILLDGVPLETTQYAYRDGYYYFHAAAYDKQYRAFQPIQPDESLGSVTIHMTSDRLNAGSTIYLVQGTIESYTLAYTHTVYFENGYEETITFSNLPAKRYQLLISTPTCTTSSIMESFTLGTDAYIKEIDYITNHTWTGDCTGYLTCSVCGEVSTELGEHAWVEGDCKKPKTCSVCNKTEGGLVHNFSIPGNCFMPEQCSICGAFGDYGEHSWESADCENPETCTACGATTGTELGHDWSEATCTTPATCSRCNATDGTAPGHVWEDATCAHAKYCINCGTTEGSALEHTWKNATCDDPKTCTACWATEGKKLGHNYVDGTCSVCGETDPDYVERFDIPLASMTMGNSLAINFAFPKASAEDWTGAYATITKTYSDGRDDVVVTVPVSEWKSTSIGGVAHYFVTFDGIAAKEMSDEVYVTIYNASDVAISNTKTDSVRDQSMRILTKDGVTDKEKTMVVDMLNYGAAAQEYFSYGSGELANAQLSEEQKTYASTPVVCENNMVNSGNYMASNVMLKSNIRMMFAFRNVDESHYAVVTFANHRGVAKNITIQGSEFTTNGSAKVVTVDALVVADGRQDVTCVVYNASGTEVARVTDSLASYTARNNGKDVLFTRMMQYSDSAYNYFHN